MEVTSAVASIKPCVSLIFFVINNIDVDIYYHQSCYVKYTINLIGKLNKNHNNKKDKNKYWIDKE